jgi:trehalose/maltose hydrolase-like predicted phosphorylase
MNWTMSVFIGGLELLNGRLFQEYSNNFSMRPALLRLRVLQCSQSSKRASSQHCSLLSQQTTSDIVIRARIAAIII